MTKVVSSPHSQPIPNAVLNLAPTVELGLLFAILCLLVAEPVPGVNESHYLPKAKHLFDGTYCPQDLFIQSHDSHGLASAVAGALSGWFSLSAVAWIGRMISWFCLAWAWQKLRVALNLHWIVGALGLCSWYFAIDYGNWAGEWAIGGFEGKSLAYPCIIVALAELLAGRWGRVWIWLGLAVAWHPLAGGWAGLSFGITWLLLPELRQRARQELVWLILGTGLGLVGVIPAATGLNSPNQVGNLVASQIHVYYRLSHHQCPSLFAYERHLAGAATLTLLILATILFAVCARCSTDRDKWRRHPLRWLLTLAWISILFSLIGLVIDRLFSQNNPIFASQLLRFYWFRWSDIIVPLSWTLTFLKLTGDGFRLQELINGARPPNSTRFALPTVAAMLTSSILVLLLFLRHVQANSARQHPAADDLLMRAPSTRTIQSDRYIEWLAVCDWARQNSPSNSLWFTPEYQQTFKWYAGRSEVVCWKDVPQDNASVRAWYERLVVCRQPRTITGERTEWTSEQILKLARKYGFRWILVDRRLQVNALHQFEIMYPISTQNRSFAVFRIPEFYFANSSGTIMLDH